MPISAAKIPSKDTWVFPEDCQFSKQFSWWKQWSEFGCSLIVCIEWGCMEACSWHYLICFIFLWGLLEFWLFIRLDWFFWIFLGVGHRYATSIALLVCLLCRFVFRLFFWQVEEHGKFTLYDFFASSNTCQLRPRQFQAVSEGQGTSHFS